MTIVEELEHAASRVGESVAPGVVRIGRDRGRGAGFIVREGAVLTNAHNLRGAETTVTFVDGRSVVGSVTASDVDGDLAVVRVETNGASPVAWAEVKPQLGAPVLAVTAATGSGARVSFGTVSAIERAFRGPSGRLISGGIEHTAPLARGSSGSPLVDLEGRLVGLNTHRLGDGFYLAVPADEDLRRRVEALARGEAPQRRYLGVALAPAATARRLRGAVGLPDREGLLVRAVDENGPAARAGVQRGDLLIEAGGRALATSEDVFAALDQLAADAPLQLRLLRGTEELQVQVTFGGAAHEGSA